MVLCEEVLKRVLLVQRDNMSAIGLNKLSDTKIKNATTKDKSYVLSDCKGLQILIHKNGGKYWEYRYTSPITKKRTKTSFGSYPTISLKEARAKRDEFANAVMQGKDITTYKKIQNALLNNFESALNEWLEKTKSNVTPKTSNNIKSMMINDLQPHLTTNTIKDIKHPQIVHALETKHKTAPVMAEKLYRYCNEFFQWCCTKGYCEFNIIMNIHKKSILPPHQTIHHKTITEDEKLKELIKSIYALGNEHTKANALKFLLHVPLRANNLINLKWDYIDFDKKLLTIPRSQMKNDNPNLQDFILPLTDEVIQILKDQAQNITRSGYVFTSPQFTFTHVSDTTLNKTLKEELKQDIRLHGFRSMYRSLANTHIKEHKTSKEARESILDHNIGTTTEKAYTHKSNFLKEQKTLLNWWSNYILKMRDEK